MTNPDSVDLKSGPDGACPPRETGEPTEPALERLARLAASLARARMAVIVDAADRGNACLARSGDLDVDIDGAALAGLAVAQTASMPEPRPAPDEILPPPDPTYVDDIQASAAHCGLAWVRANPHARFVALHPLIGAQSQNLATLVVLHDTPLRLDAATRAALADVAALLADTLSRRTPVQTAAGDRVAAKPPDQMLHDVLNALFVFVGILDLDGTLLDANDPPLDAADLTIDDVRGRPFWECYWWSFCETTQARVRDAVGRARSGEVVRFDIKVRLAGDHFIMIDFLLAPLRDGAGHINRLVASGVDISRRERAELELRRVVRIVDEAPFLIRSATPDGRVLYLNRYARKLLGYAPDSDLGNAEVAHHHPDWAMQLLRLEGYPAARKQGQWRGETAIIDTDGREVPTSHAIVAHPDADGGTEFFSSIAIDMSGEKAAQAALKESELRFRGTFENAAVGIAHVSREGRWLRVNERLLEIVGYGRPELVQMTFQDITHPDDLADDLKLFEQLKAGEIDSYSLDKRYYRKDGTLIWVEITVSMQETASGTEPYVIAIIEDITERKQAEQRQRLLLSELNHRVKNTLATIQSIANQTLRQSSDPRSFVARFNGRLQSLSGAHDLLTIQTWDGADLASLLRT